jgi:hypothetical protein
LTPASDEGRNRHRPRRPQRPGGSTPTRAAHPRHQPPGHAGRRWPRTPPLLSSNVKCEWLSSHSFPKAATGRFGICAAAMKAAYGPWKSQQFLRPARARWLPPAPVQGSRGDLASPEPRWPALASASGRERELISSRVGTSGGFGRQILGLEACCSHSGLRAALRHSTPLTRLDGPAQSFVNVLTVQPLLGESVMPLDSVPGQASMASLITWGGGEGPAWPPLGLNVYQLYCLRALIPFPPPSRARS